MYTIDSNVDEPIMLLNKQIGCTYDENGNWDGTPYIDGAEFQSELMYLDTLGKKSILVKIVSEGGSVMEGMKIFDAILTTKTPVDTYNAGVCASIAGAIFMAGRKRYCADYAQFMTHPVRGGDDKSTQAFSESVISMIQSKSSLHKDSVKYLMEATTWIGASDCLQHGIATDIVVTKTENKKYMPVDDVMAMLQYSNNILNEKINPKKMELKLITNKLKLVEGANEQSILDAINQLESEAQAAIADKETAKAKVDELQLLLDQAQADLEAANAATAAAQDEAATLEATEIVNKYIARIGNKPETLSKWVNMVKLDKAGTIDMIESLPLNVVSNRAVANEDFKATTSAATVMAEITNRTKKA